MSGKRYSAIQLTYSGKKSVEEIVARTPKAIFAAPPPHPLPNLLIQGDCLPVMRYLLEDCGLEGQIGLIYIDPPFATNTTYRIGKRKTGTISTGKEDEEAYSDTVTGCEYLEFLRERLVYLRMLLSDRGSIYLHTDCKVGHYIKVVMDEIFGPKNFRNDITRIKCNPKNFAHRRYGNIKDMVLFYSKTNQYTWNEPRLPMTEDDIARLFRKRDASGRMYTTVPLHAPGEVKNGPTGHPWRGVLPPPGRHWAFPPDVLDTMDERGEIEWSSSGVPRRKIFADEQRQKRAQDVWEFKDPQQMLYPTTKNIDMLKLIIETSSNPGDWVLDCFCGSGTTLVAAQQLGRRWIGIDKSERAISVARKRIAEALTNESSCVLLTQVGELKVETITPG